MIHLYSLCNIRMAAKEIKQWEKILAFVIAIMINALMDWKAVSKKSMKSEKSMAMTDKVNRDSPIVASKRVQISIKRPILFYFSFSVFPHRVMGTMVGDRSYVRYLVRREAISPAYLQKHLSERAPV